MINNVDDIFDQIGKFIKGKAAENDIDFDELSQKFQEKFGDFKKFLEFAWNCEERTTEILTFQDCVGWIKPKISAEIHSGAVVYKTAKNDGGQKLDVKISLLDKNGNPLPDSKSPFLIVHCNSIDADLKNAFGDKNMIILR